MDTILKKITSVGKTVEKLKPSHTVGVIVRWCRHGKQYRKKERKTALSHVRLFVTPLSVPCQTPRSRQEYWCGLAFPSPGDLPNPGIEPRSTALQADSLPTELRGKPI